MNARARSCLVAPAMVLATTLVSVAATGFRFGIGNNVFHIPYVLRHSELPALRDDAFYGSLEKFTSLIWPLLRAVSNEANVEQVFLLGHVVSRLLAFLALSWFYRANGASRHGALSIALIASAVSPWMMDVSDVGEHGLFRDYFTHSEVTWGPLVAGLVAAQLGRLRLAAAFAGLVFVVNAFVGAWLVTILAVTVAAHPDQRRDWRLLLGSSMTFLSIAAPVAIWIGLAITDKAHVPAFSYIEHVRAYYPDHFLIESTPAHALRDLALLTWCGLMAAFTGPHRRFWTSVLGALVAVLLIGTVLPYVFDSRLVFGLHLLRSAGVLQCLAVILSVSCVARAACDADSRAPMRIIAVLAGGALITFRPEPVSLLVCAVCLTFLALTRQRGTGAVSTSRSAAISSRDTRGLAALLVVAAIAADLWFVGISVGFMARWALILGVMGAASGATGRRGAGVAAMVAIWGVLAALVVATHVRARSREPAEDPARAELMQWVRRSELDGPFLFPVGRAYGQMFDEFQLRTRKPVWVDWKQGAAVMWEPSFYWQWMPRFREVKELRTAEEFAEYAVRRDIPCVVLPKSLGKCTSNADVAFENAAIAICCYQAPTRP